MEIQITKVMSNMKRLNIDISTDEGYNNYVALLHTYFTLLYGWSYEYESDLLIIHVDQDIIIPDLSEIGEVIPNGNTLG